MQSILTQIITLDIMGLPLLIAIIYVAWAKERSGESDWNILASKCVIILVSCTGCRPGPWEGESCCPNGPHQVEGKQWWNRTLNKKGNPYITVSSQRLTGQFFQPRSEGELRWLSLGIPWERECFIKSTGRNYMLNWAILRWFQGFYIVGFSDGLFHLSILCSPDDSVHVFINM